jgi:hypothetical protein
VRSMNAIDARWKRDCGQTYRTARSMSRFGIRMDEKHRYHGFSHNARVSYNLGNNSRDGSPRSTRRERESSSMTEAISHDKGLRIVERLKKLASLTVVYGDLDAPIQIKFMLLMWKVPDAPPQ